MRVNDLKTVCFAVALSAAVGAGVFAQGQAAAPAQNLQVLPKDTPRPQLTQMMRGFAAALGGVECTHCHVGTAQERSKDDNPKKAVARQMIKMTAALNNDLKNVGDPATAGAAKVTCFTCHRGTLKPLTAPPGGGLVTTGHDR